MSVPYQIIGWNRQKKIYDGVIAAGCAIYLAAFVGGGALLHPNATAETLIIRAFGTLALLLLHIILLIGPLCRLRPVFLPLLYNRRHLGVTMFLAGLVHGMFSIIQFHALGDVNPLLSLFSGDLFQVFGFAALLILFVMAATSHDFWLHNLPPLAWKKLHMLVYLAYTLLIAHVSFGALQSETSPVLASLLIAGAVLVAMLHLAAALQESRMDRNLVPAKNGFVEVGDFDSIAEGRAKVVSIGGERIAVYRHEGKPFALSNVCRHQGGPLGEGKIVDGCVTCPWHGYQYKPDTGTSPPPYNDQVPTFHAVVVDGKVQVNPCPR